MNKSSLGRGLGSLIPDLSQQDDQALDQNQHSSTDEKIIKVPINKIEKNPWQPRDNFEHAELEDLIESIKKHGIIQPLVVTKTASGYQLIAGERRFKAAVMLELETVPVIVRSAEDIEKLELSLIENLQRQDLNPIEEARAFQRLIDEFNLTQEEVANRVGKKRATISNTLRLLDLPDEVQQALIDRQITAGHAKVILSVEGDNERLKLFKKVLETPLTVRGAEDVIKGGSSKARPKSDKRIIEKDLETLDKEDRLRKALGTKVNINNKNGRGQINIEFYSVEELEALVQKLSE